MPWSTATRKSASSGWRPTTKAAPPRSLCSTRRVSRRASAPPPRSAVLAIIWRISIACHRRARPVGPTIPRCPDGMRSAVRPTPRRSFRAMADPRRADSTASARSAARTAPSAPWVPAEAGRLPGVRPSATTRAGCSLSHLCHTPASSGVPGAQPARRRRSACHIRSAPPRPTSRRAVMRPGISCHHWISPRRSTTPRPVCSTATIRPTGWRSPPVWTSSLPPELGSPSAGTTSITTATTMVWPSTICASIGRSSRPATSPR